MTNALLTISNLSLSHGGNYRVRLSNVVSAVLSEAVELKVGTPPRVSSVPYVSAVVGGTAVLSASSTGTPPLTFIWRCSDIRATSAVDVVHGSNSFLYLSPIRTSDAGIYGVTVTNLFGTNVSAGGAGSLTIQADNDSDGLGDPWESLYGFDTNDAADAVLDLDGDSHSALQEFTAGTDPTNRLDVLRFINIGRESASGVQFTFRAVSNVSYTVQTKEHPGVESWTRLQDVPALRTNRAIQVFDPNPGTGRIYRITTPAQR